MSKDVTFDAETREYPHFAESLRRGTDLFYLVTQLACSQNHVVWLTGFRNSFRDTIFAAHIVRDLHSRHAISSFRRLDEILDSDKAKIVGQQYQTNVVQPDRAEPYLHEMHVSSIKSFVFFMRAFQDQAYKLLLVSMADPGLNAGPQSNMKACCGKPVQFNSALKLIVQNLPEYPAWFCPMLRQRNSMKEGTPTSGLATFGSGGYFSTSVYMHEFDVDLDGKFLDRSLYLSIELANLVIRQGVTTSILVEDPDIFK